MVFALISIMIISVVFNACQLSLNLSLTQQKNETATKQEMNVLLIQAQAGINGALENLDNSLQTACQRLSATDLTGPAANAVLNDLYTNNSLLIVNAATSDAKDILVAVQPSKYSSIIGEDISGQEQNIEMHHTMRPAMSDLIPLVEGFPGVVMVAPIFDGDSKLIGSLSIVIQPYLLIGPIVEGPINGTPISMWAMQTNGTLIYDPDPQQQGKNLFTDPIYTNYSEVQAFTHHVAEEKSGYGTYQYYNTNLDNASKQVVAKEAYWTTVGIYGTEWRLVVVHVINP